MKIRLVLASKILPLALFFTQSAEAQNLTGQAAVAQDLAQSIGESTYLVIDKANARLIFVENNKVVVDTPILLGIERGDDYPIEMRVAHTPAGFFANPQIVTRDDLSIYPDRTAITFQCKDGEYCYAIHGLIDVRGQDRRGRILSPDPNVRRITYGCPNVGRVEFRIIMEGLRRHATVQASGQIMYPPLFVLPEEVTDPVQTRAYFETKHGFAPRQ